MSERAPAARALHARLRTVLGAAWALAAPWLAPSSAARAQECANPQPEWVFCDDFEDSADKDGALGRWDDQGLGPQNLVLETDPSIVHGGARALALPAHKGKDTGGGPSKWFLPGYDQIYVRFWTRFAGDYHYLHHMVFIGASQASDKWAAFGTAGCRPNGANFFVTQVEPFGESGSHPPPGAWGFYTYSNDMQCDPGDHCASYADPQQICSDCAARGSPCSQGLECCWGTNDIASPAVQSPLGKWTCVEARVQANSGSEANGSQTLFIDGVQVGQWSGIRFRTDEGLKINSLGLWHYVTDDVYAAGQDSETLWFDDVVVSTAPIGCGPEAQRDAGAVQPERDAAASGASSMPRRPDASSTPGGAGASGAGSGGAGAHAARPRDAGTSRSGGGAPDGGASSGDTGGCGCRVTRAQSSALGFAWPATLLVLLARRRRTHLAR